MEDLTRAKLRDLPADAEAVRACVESLYAAAAAIQLYGEAHPSTDAAVDRCVGGLGDAMGWVGELTFRTAFDGLYWRGFRVAEERDERAGLARHVHVEGISSFSLLPGIRREEIVELLRVLRTNLSLPQYEEYTLEALLWQSELEHVAFSAVAELMDAEALSGRDELMEALTQGEVVNRLVDLQDGDLQPERDLGRLLREAAVEGGGDVVDQWHLDASVDMTSPDEREWRVTFVERAGDDAATLRAWRDHIREERASEILARVNAILLRCLVARRPEIRPSQAMSFAASIIRQVYVLGDPVGLLRVLEDGRRVARSIERLDPRAHQVILSFLDKSFSPMRVARMLRNLDPSVETERRALARLLDVLPGDALTAFFDGLASEENPEHLIPVVGAVVSLLGDRVDRWLAPGPAVAHERAAPLMYALRLVNARPFAHHRSTMLGHASPVVRESVLDWYRADLPDADVKVVSAMLLDKSPMVREAASRVLLHHRPAAAVRALARTLQNDGFHGLAVEVKVEMCSVYGRIAGPSGMTTLGGLLQTRVGLLGDANLETTIEAAAMGLAAIGSPNALEALRKGSRSLSGARRAACAAALEVHAEQQRRDATVA